MVTLGVIIGLVAWFLVRYLVAGLYTVNQNERAVKTIFGRAERLPKTTLEDPFAEYLRQVTVERMGLSASPETEFPVAEKIRALKLRLIPE